MTASLLNVMMDDQVTALLDNEMIRDDLPDSERMMSRAEAYAVIHATIWAYSCRNSSTAGAMAKFSLFEALNLETWKFKQRDPDSATEGL